MVKAIALLIPGLVWSLYMLLYALFVLFNHTNGVILIWGTNSAVQFPILWSGKQPGNRLRSFIPTPLASCEVICYRIICVRHCSSRRLLVNLDSALESRSMYPVHAAGNCPPWCNLGDHCYRSCSRLCSAFLPSNISSALNLRQYLCLIFKLLCSMAGQWTGWSPSLIFSRFRAVLW
jgi:hypothetical protein